MSSKKQSKTMKDLIRIGVFGALLIVVAFLLAFTIGFLPPVLVVLPAIIGLFAGMIFTVMLEKVDLAGGILIPSILLGLCLFTMAPYGMMCFCLIGGGILGEILYHILGKHTTKGLMAGSSSALLGLALGEYIPFIWMQEAYHALMANDDPAMLEIAQWCMDTVNVPIMIVLCLVTVLVTSLGVVWGKKIIAKRLAK